MNSKFIMMSLSKQICETRKQQGFTQEELADKCRVDIRTIQRIESGKVTPRLYTLRIINEVLGTNFELKDFNNITEEDRKFRQIFERRKQIRIGTFVSAMIFMFLIIILGFPTWNLFGMPKQTWGPFFYLIMAIHIAGIFVYWRCPVCNGLLGDVFNIHSCSKCGYKFDDEV